MLYSCIPRKYIYIYVCVSVYVCDCAYTHAMHRVKRHHCVCVFMWLCMYYNSFCPPNVKNTPSLDPKISQRCVPSGYVKIAIENGHRNSEFSH